MFSTMPFDESILRLFLPQYIELIFSFLRFQKLDLIFSSTKKASLLTRLKISDVSSSAHTLTVKKHAKPIPRDYDTLLAIVIKLPSYMS
jgi:hypothetical protein